MDFDPSTIARIGQTAGPDLVGGMGQALSMKALIDQNALQGLQLQQTRSSIERDAKLRDLMTGADVATPEGQNALIENLSRGGFTQEALQLHGQLLQARESQGKIDKLDLELEDARNEAIVNAGAPLALQAESLIDQGMSPDQVNQQITPVYQQYMKQLLEAKLPNGQPLLGDSERAWVAQNQNYDHAAFTSMLVGRSTDGRKWIADQREARATAARDAEARRHARVVEGNDAARLRLEGARLAEQREARLEAQTKPFTVEGPDGLPVLVTSGRDGSVTPVPGWKPAGSRDADNQRSARAMSIGNQIAVVDKALGHPGREAATGLSSRIDPRNYVPGTDAADFQAVLEQITGTAFLQAFESLRGGGQITQVEGEKATNAIARLQRSQSDEEFAKSLNDLRQVMTAGYERLTGKPYAAPSPPAAGGDDIDALIDQYLPPQRR